MKKVESEKNQIKYKRQSLLVKVVFSLVLILFACQIFTSNLISASGDKIQLLEQRYVAIASQNDLLKKELAEVTSLSNIQKLAEEQGLVKNNTVLYLQNEVNVAMEKIN